MKTMLFERVGAVLVLVHGEKDPSDAEWSEYVRCFAGAIQSEDRVIGLLVTSLGGAPNAMQRKAVVKLEDSTRNRPVITCVCTNSVIARGVITAIRWISDTPMHGVLLNDLDTALELMKVPPSQHADVKAVVARLQSQLG